MRRRLFTFSAAVSAVLFVAGLGLWVLSYLPERVWLRWVDGRAVVAAADGGDADLLEKYYFGPPPQGTRGVRQFVAQLRTGAAPIAGPQPIGPPRAIRVSPPAARAAAFGVEVYTFPTANGSYRAALVPAAYPVLPAAALPAFWLAVRALRRRRGRTGLCHSCGYDLRATPNRCPECGADPEPAKGAA